MNLNWLKKIKGSDLCNRHSIFNYTRVNILSFFPLSNNFSIRPKNGGLKYQAGFKCTGG